MSDPFTIASALIGLVALTLCGSVLVFHFITGVPPVPARSSEIACAVALLRDARLADGAVIYELGCGWGGLMLALAKAFPRARVVGIERSPLPYWVSCCRARNLPNVTLTRANFYDLDLRGADAVACYLMIRPMQQLAARFDRMLAPGTPVVSVAFMCRGRQPSAVVKGRGLRGDVALYRW